MRIIGGKYKGLRIHSHTRGVRPMMDIMRESLFMALDIRHHLVGAHIIDLFAGSGTLALEALSRGAASATMCDIDKNAVRALKTQLPTQIYTNEHIRIHRRDAEAFIRQSKKHYDIIFLDPPYQYSRYTALLRALYRSTLLTHSSTIVLHHQRSSDISASIPDYTLAWHKRFGNSIVKILHPHTVQ